MQEWLNGSWSTFLDDFSLPHVIVLILASLMIIGLSFAYYLQNRRYKVKDKPKSYSILIEKFIDMVKAMVLETFGPRFIKYTPYFIFLFVFLFILNIFQIFGISEATTSYTVPLTLGFITWVSSIFCAIKYQKLSFLKKLCFCITVKKKKIPILINPIQVMGQFTPLISISFRIWGNIIAGAIIYAVIYWAIGSIASNLAVVPIIIGGILVIPAITGYLSLFVGYIQAYVFTLLSMTYISMPIEEGLDSQAKLKNEKILKQQKKVDNLKKNSISNQE